MVNMCIAFAQRAYTLSNENRDFFFKDVKLFQSIISLFNEETCTPMFMSQAAEVQEDGLGRWTVLV